MCQIEFNFLLSPLPLHQINPVHLFIACILNPPPHPEQPKFRQMNRRDLIQLNTTCNYILLIGIITDWCYKLITDGGNQQFCILINCLLLPWIYCYEGIFKQFIICLVSDNMQKICRNCDCYFWSFFFKLMLEASIGRFVRWSLCWSVDKNSGQLPCHLGSWFLACSLLIT